MAVIMMNAVFWDVTPCDSFMNQYRLRHLGNMAFMAWSTEAVK
jgi:hypothetical protein